MSQHLQDIDSKQKTLLTNIQNNFNNISQLNTINLQPLVASFVSKNLASSTHQSPAPAFDPRGPTELATGNQGGAAKDLKWDQNQPQTRKQQQVQAQAEPPKQVVPNKQQLMLLLRNYKQ